MGLARYPLALQPGSYRLGPRALRRVDNSKAASSAKALIDLDTPCVFALDESHAGEFVEWYHRTGNECSYMALTIAERLPEFEAAVGARVGFYWEREVAEGDHEGQYVLDPATVLKLS